MEKQQSKGNAFRTIFLISLALFLVLNLYSYGVSWATPTPITVMLSYAFPAILGILVISLIGWIMLSGSLIRKIFILILFLILGAVLTLTFITGPAKLMGKSMEPTYLNGQQLMINKIAYRFLPPERGDVIDYKFQETDFIGRIVGLPGEEVVVNNGSVLINGDQIDEPYAHWENYDLTASKTFRLKGDEYLILNDNRNSLMNVIKLPDFVGKIY
jgi:signal peptidase I